MAGSENAKGERNFKKSVRVSRIQTLKGGLLRPYGY